MGSAVPEPEGFSRFRAIGRPFERRLYLAALLTSALEPRGIRPIVVGGNALEFYTLGGYATGDLDLVVSAVEPVDLLLRSWGFERLGRHWYSESLDLAVEIPGDSLAGDLARLTVVEVEGLVAYVIGIEDLVIDRLSAYVHWRSEEDGRWAQELLTLHGSTVDWDYLAVRGREARVLEALERVRQAGEARAEEE